MKENKQTHCEPCEENFKQKVNELIKEGHAPSRMERMKREHEVKQAFNHAAPASTEKSHAKEHAMAGGAKKK